jgi:hypothetical protein
MKEKLQEYALIAEIVGAIAIVISLITVAMQINQSAQETALNTNAVQVSAYQALVGDVITINLIISENPQLAELVTRITDGGTFNNNAEVHQYDQYISAIFEHGDMAYYQYEKGIINEERLWNILGIVTTQFQIDYVQNEWDEKFKVRVDSGFVKYLENMKVVD